MPARSRTLYLLLTVGTVVLGLATRHPAVPLPAFVRAYAGDVLWATMVYVLIAAVWPRWSTTKVAIAAAAFSLAIELSQLYQAQWITAVRHTRLGGLVLGFGFLWSDLLCYAVGIALAAAVDHLVLSASTRRTRLAAG